jgi:hypothetical protein
VWSAASLDDPGPAIERALDEVGGRVDVVVFPDTDDPPSFRPQDGIM